MSEVPLVFGNAHPELNVTFSSIEAQLAANFSAAFTAFAKGLPVLGGAWPAYNASARAGLVINDTSVAGALGPAADVCEQVWDRAGYLH